MKLAGIILFGFVFLSISATAQILERQVIASGGGANDVGTFTIGEVIVATENLEVIAGFQHPSFMEGILTGAENIRDISNELNVYPIPANTEVTINGEGFEGMDTDVVLYTANGRQIEVQPYRSENEIKLNLANLSSGYFYLRLINETNNTTANYKILKK